MLNQLRQQAEVYIVTTKQVPMVSPSDTCPLSAEACSFCDSASPDSTTIKPRRRRCSVHYTSSAARGDTAVKQNAVASHCEITPREHAGAFHAPAAAGHGEGTAAAGSHLLADCIWPSQVGGVRR